jgi:uncharacterized protein HemX
MTPREPAPGTWGWLLAKHKKAEARVAELEALLREARKWLPMHKHMQAAVDLMDRIDAALAKASRK